MTPPTHDPFPGMCQADLIFQSWMQRLQAQRCSMLVTAQNWCCRAERHGENQGLCLLGNPGQMGPQVATPELPSIPALSSRGQGLQLRRRAFPGATCLSLVHQQDPQWRAGCRAGSARWLSLHKPDFGHRNTQSKDRTDCEGCPLTANTHRHTSNNHHT